MLWLEHNYQLQDNETSHICSAATNFQQIKHRWVCIRESSAVGTNASVSLSIKRARLVWTQQRWLRQSNVLTQHWVPLHKWHLTYFKVNTNSRVSFGTLYMSKLLHSRKECWTHVQMSFRRLLTSVDTIWVIGQVSSWVMCNWWLLSVLMTSWFIDWYVLSLQNYPSTIKRGKVWLKQICSAYVNVYMLYK